MNETRKFGTSAVFFTAISTILGAILFLRFGYAVGTVGMWGTFLLIIIGHLVTIPTAFAISELATNKRVEGGGEYFIISRSFGLNIGGTLGMALYLSQTISVAFYIIAFTEAFQFVFNYFATNYGYELPRQAISIPVMLILSALVLTKGANLGLKTLYIVIAMLFISIVMFFLGKPIGENASNHFASNSVFTNTSQLFIVFSIIFPAFTGMTAGVGLSGDLKNPGKAIPMGTTAATITGLIIYFFITYKLSISASTYDLSNNQLIMANIALFGAYIVPLGLAASTFSSALGSVMVAPRTLQALASDKSVPVPYVNGWLSKTRKKDNEPINASILTCVIALIFVALGNVNIVAQIITMFFLVTYGTLCLISFLHHFGSSPSYRPSFKSKWFLSLLGFLASVWVMFQISTLYSFIAFSLMILLYIYMDRYHKNRKGLASIFANTLFQINRNLQIFLQRKRNTETDYEWRPSAICISKNSFERNNAFQLLNWISHKYGFGTYLHLIKGYFSKSTNAQAKEELKRLLNNIENVNHVYIDTIISPSTTSAIAQSIQIPGIAGMENNMVIFEYDKKEPHELEDIVDNFRMVDAGGFDVCILASSSKPIIHKNGIHIWLNSFTNENSNLMILLSFIILGHPEWRKGNIKIFNVCREKEQDDVKARMKELMESGRMPITSNNVEIIVRPDNVTMKTLINEYSQDAGLTMIGFDNNSFKNGDTSLFTGYESVGDLLFVYSHKPKEIE
ncbi:Amino acid transporter [uncultured Paludibacter sp.]|nr:Amino acid transporter [uncultured Paludibacter sp.]